EVEVEGVIAVACEGVVGFVGAGAEVGAAVWACGVDAEAVLAGGHDDDRERPGLVIGDLGDDDRFGEVGLEGFLPGRQGRVWWLVVWGSPGASFGGWRGRGGLARVRLPRSTRGGRRRRGRTVTRRRAGRSRLALPGAASQEPRRSPRLRRRASRCWLRPRCL